MPTGADLSRADCTPGRAMLQSWPKEAPSTQGYITHLPHELAFSVHAQVELSLLALDPDLTPEGICLH